jgi:hypothetical protein
VEVERLISLRVESVDTQSVEAMDNHDLLTVYLDVPHYELSVLRTSVPDFVEACLHSCDVTGFTDVKENSTH